MDHVMVHVEEALRACAITAMWVSEADFQQCEAPDWVQESHEDQKAQWFFAAANGRYVEKVSEAVARITRKHNVGLAPTCGNETIQNFRVYWYIQKTNRIRKT